MGATHGQAKRITAQEWNNMRDAADMASKHRAGATAKTARPPAPPSRASNDIYTINATGAAIDRFAVVGIKGVGITDVYQAREIMAVEIEAITEAHIAAGRFCVLAEPSADKSVARGWTSGTFLATVNVTDADHTGIRVTTDGIVSDAANVHGALLTFDSASVPGEMLCLVTMAQPADPIRYGTADSDWVDDETDTGNGCYVMVTPCADLAGTALDPVPTESVKVYLPRGGRREDPNVRSGAVIAWMEIGYEDGVGSGASPQQIGVALHDHLDGKVDESIKLLDAAATTPDGWTVVSDATQKSLVGNEEPTNAGATHGAASFNGTDIEHEDIAIDSALIADHALTSVTTKEGGSAALSHDSAGAVLAHGHSVTISGRDDIQYASPPAETVALAGSSGVAEDAGAIPAHTHADHSAAEMVHTHTFESTEKLEHTGSGTTSVDHKDAEISKWGPTYAIKVILRTS